jgi:hypothetical protein
MTRGIAPQPARAEGDARRGSQTNTTQPSRTEQRPSDWPVSEERPTLPTPPGSEPSAATGDAMFDSEARPVSDTIPAPPPLPADADES